MAEKNASVAWQFNQAKSNQKRRDSVLSIAAAEALEAWLISSNGAGNGTGSQKLKKCEDLTKIIVDK